MSWKPASPCKDCQTRFVGCHSSCAKYIDFQQELEVMRKKVRENKDDAYGNGYTEYIVGVHNARNRKKSRGSYR